MFFYFFYTRKKKEYSPTVVFRHRISLARGEMKWSFPFTRAILIGWVVCVECFCLTKKRKFSPPIGRIKNLKPYTRVKWHVVEYFIFDEWINDDQVVLIKGVSGAQIIIERMSKYQLWDPLYSCPNDSFGFVSSRCVISAEQLTYNLFING